MKIDSKGESLGGRGGVNSLGLGQGPLKEEMRTKERGQPG